MATPWRKCLYIRQPFPDNYTDASFLSALRKNANLASYSYKSLIYYTISLSRQLNLAMSFNCLFTLLYQSSKSPETAPYWTHGLFFGTILLTILYVLCHLSVSQGSVKSGLLILFYLGSLTPILQTLTLDTSSDSIWALSFILFLVHLLSHSYSYSPTAPLVDGVSLNASLFASVLLASRLTSQSLVFGLILLAVLWFALLPCLPSYRLAKPSASIAGLLLLSLFSLGLCYSISGFLFGFHLFLLLWTSFGSPYLFLLCRKYKNEIQGPWDEARVILSSRSDLSLKEVRG